jgi:hypothetical protein
MELVTQEEYYYILGCHLCGLVEVQGCSEGMYHLHLLS